ncbi:MAG: hypothetical protein HQ530_00520 [Parcubacteria group bacterium]|nr:hypothetical protein [Parcubacteria group bacterium]
MPASNQESDPATSPPTEATEVGATPEVTSEQEAPGPETTAELGGFINSQVEAVQGQAQEAITSSEEVLTEGAARLGEESAGEPSELADIKGAITGLAEQAATDIKQQGEVAAEGQSLEVPRLPTVGKIYEMYGYQPPQREKQAAARPLEVKWRDEQVTAGIQQAAEQILASLEQQQDEFIEVASGDDQAVFQVSTWKSVNDERRFVDLKLQETDDGKKVANFYCSVQPEEQRWELAHNLVAKEHRGLIVGPRMMEMMENCAKVQANRTGETQTIVISASQVEVAAFAQGLKYQPELAEDARRLQLLAEGNSDEFKVVTANGYNNQGGDREGWLLSLEEYRDMFEQEFTEQYEGSEEDKAAAYTKYEQQRWPEITSQEIKQALGHDPSEFEGRCYSINFKKKIPPDEK